MGLAMISPIVFVLHRFVVSTIALLPVVFILRKRIPKDRSTLSRLTLYSSLYVTEVIAVHIGLVQESSGIGAVLTFAQPIFVICMAIPFLKEKATVTKLSGIAAGLTGVLIILFGQVGSFTLSSALVIVLGGFFWALSIVYFKKYLSHIDPFIAVFFQLCLGLVPLTLFSTIGGAILFLPSESSYLWIVLYSSIGSLVVGTVLWIFLLEREEATILSGSSFVIPAIAMLIGSLLFGEEIVALDLVAAFFVFAGIFLVNRGIESKRRQLRSSNGTRLEGR